MDANAFEKAKAKAIELCKAIQEFDIEGLVAQHGKNQMAKPDHSKNNQLWEECYYSLHKAKSILPKSFPTMVNNKNQVTAKPTKEK